ncbi:hypothetical protein GC175_32240 [bacterium]|nr:hypothetical protein [bacterium]
MASKEKTPPMKSSNEASEKQLQLAKEQGKAYRKALDEMAKHEADIGEMKPAGNFVVALAVEEAEGMYHKVDGKLEWQEPDKENVHIEITAFDAADGRFIPELTVHVTVSDEDGKQVGRYQQPFLWHPWLYHYGRNWQLPGDGNYTVKVEIDAPEFGRHDKENGKRYAEPVEVVFENVEIETGRKLS